MNRQDKYIFLISVVLAAVVLSWIWGLTFKDILPPEIGGSWMSPFISMVITGFAVAVAVGAA